jgi:hypothetical protein
MAEVIRAAQQLHQSAELRAKASALHSREQRSPGGGLAVGADQPMELMFDHERLDLWNVDHQMVMRFWILTTKVLTETAASAGEMGDDIRALLHWKEVAARARMTDMAAALAAGALALLFGWGLEPAPITGWRLGRVPGPAALLLLQLGDTSG